nr:tetratricopeptide repeat protein [Aquabacterium terrae]
MHSSARRTTPAQLALALGNARMEAGDPVAAERLYSEAVKQDPGLSMLYSALGASQHLQKKFVAASGSYRKALELDPRDLSAQVGLAGIAFEQGHHHEAIELFERTLQQAPDEPVALWGLARSYEATNDSRTDGIFKKYLTVAPQSSRTEYARRRLAGR